MNWSFILILANRINFFCRFFKSNSSSDWNIVFKTEYWVKRENGDHQNRIEIRLSAKSFPIKWNREKRVKSDRRFFGAFLLNSWNSTIGCAAHANWMLKNKMESLPGGFAYHDRNASCHRYERSRNAHAEDTKQIAANLHVRVDGVKCIESALRSNCFLCTK